MRSKIKVDPNAVEVIPHRNRMGHIAGLAQVLANSDGDLLPPAVVRDNKTQKYVLLSGERRWLAAQRLPGMPLFVIVCDFWGDFLAWLTLDKSREHPAHKSMPTPVTDMVLMTETIQKYLRPGREDRLDDTLGDYFGIRSGRIGEARSLKRILDGNNPADIQELAEAEWENVRTGSSSPSAAFQRVRKAQVRKDTPPVDPDVQRRKLKGAAGICAGLVDGLANFGDLSEKLTKQEIAEYAEQLSTGRRALESVIRKLNGVTA
jgi:hypothetical protein